MEYDQQATTNLELRAVRCVDNEIYEVKWSEGFGMIRIEFVKCLLVR
jgi:hypothetical protein